MNSTKGMDRGGRDYWMAERSMSYLVMVERDFHEVVGVADTGRVVCRDIGFTECDLTSRECKRHQKI